MTDVPGFEFRQHAELSDIDGGSSGLEVDPFRHHHFALYLPVTPPTPVFLPAGVAAG